MLHLVGRLARLATAAMVTTALVVVSASPARADDDDAQPPPSAASVDAALAAVQRDHPGRVLKVELEREDDAPSGWVYEMKVLTGAGRVIEVELDAASLEQLSVEGDR